MKTITPRNLVAGIAVVALLLGLATSGRASIVIQETSGPVITGSWTVGWTATGGPFDTITGTLDTPLFEIPGLRVDPSTLWAVSGPASTSVATISGTPVSPLDFTTTFSSIDPATTSHFILDFTIFDQGNLVGEVRYQWVGNEFDLVPVPEPSTVLAGVLLLLPFGASGVRALRRSHALKV